MKARGQSNQFPHELAYREDEGTTDVKKSVEVWPPTNHRGARHHSMRGDSKTLAPEFQACENNFAIFFAYMHINFELLEPVPSLAQGSPRTVTNARPSRVCC